MYWIGHRQGTSYVGILDTGWDTEGASDVLDVAQGISDEHDMTEGTPDVHGRTQPILCTCGDSGRI